MSWKKRFEKVEAKKTSEDNKISPKINLFKRKMEIGNEAKKEIRNENQRLEIKKISEELKKDVEVIQNRKEEEAQLKRVELKKKIIEKKIKNTDLEMAHHKERISSTQNRMVLAGVLIFATIFLTYLLPGDSSTRRFLFGLLDMIIYFYGGMR